MCRIVGFWGAVFGGFPGGTPGRPDSYQPPSQNGTPAEALAIPQDFKLQTFLLARSSVCAGGRGKGFWRRERGAVG